ncbi:MAG: DUF5906 domain-containing protein, partial [Bacteroidia bacterium]|nr:DUF5906 domain-containing protein [Bacteroidia bacterium]
ANSTLRARWHPNQTSAQEMALFRALDNGDIEILYPDLSGGVEVYQHPENGRIELYTRTRVAEPKGDAKYLGPRGVRARPYFTPGVIDAYREKTPFDTLVIVEGEFKAFKGHLQGLKIVALPGYQNFREPTGKLFREFGAIIETCRVRNVLLLHDADALQVRYAPPDERDLYKRPNGFCSAVLAFKEQLLPWREQIDFYYGHLDQDKLGTDGPKGLDDLYLWDKLVGSEQLVTEELLRLSAAARWFSISRISSWSEKQLRRYFHLSSEREFYKAYASVLGDRPFRYRGYEYRWNYEKGGGEGELELLHDHDQQFVRVGCDYYKHITVTYRDSLGDEQDEKRLVLWRKAEITQDFVHTKKAPNIFEKMAKYDAFCNVPCHEGDYRRVVGGCYNLYFPVEWTPLHGPWQVTEAYLRHLFDNEYQQCYEIALDYLTLLWRQPTQKLPILCLVSPEKATGKTTFTVWLQLIFGSNVTMIGNAEIESEYNDDFATKLVISIDEGFIDKAKVVEKLKSMSTAERVKMNGKFKSREDVHFFGKFVIATNYADNFLRIDDEENRFWVNRVPRLKAQDPFLMAKLREEIPAFLSFLSNRQITHPQRSRHWFEPALLRTTALEAVVSTTESWTVKNIKEIVRATLLEYEIWELRWTVTDLIEEMKRREIKSQQFWELVRVLKKDLALEQAKGSWKYKKPRKWYNDDGSWQLEWQGDRGRYYRFTAEQFLTEEERSHLPEKPAAEPDDAPLGRTQLSLLPEDDTDEMGTPAF